MTIENISVRYEVNSEWVRELRKSRKTNGWVVWAYYYISCIMLNVLFLGLGSAIGSMAIAFFGIEGSMSFIFVVLGAGVGLFFLWQWGKLVGRRIGGYVKDIYRIGSEVTYDFSPDGIRMRTYAQDCWTAWIIVHDIYTTDKALIIRTPFSVLLLPLSELPLPTEDVLKTLRQWQQSAPEGTT